MHPYIITRHLHRINYLRPQQDQIDIRDIAHALSRLPRFNGHTLKPYYVAQHLCFCCDVAPADEKREAFAHDWQEAFVTDCPSPLKALLPQFSEIETRLEQVIVRKYRLRYPWSSVVREVDHRALLTEMRDLTRRTDWREYPAKPYEQRIEPWDSARAKREFMKRFRVLFK